MSILFPELLTGSTPVLDLINPVADLFLIGLYGGGVLVIREVTVRWGRGWGPVLVLGAAYGVAEEGLGTRTFFDAALAHNTFPAPWGHWLGVNWDWAVQLTLFHAVFSIALPILLVGVLVPESRDRPLLGGRALVAVFLAYAATVGVMFELFDRGYSVGPGLEVGTLVAIGLLVLVAYAMPAQWVRPRSAAPDRPTRAFVWAGGLYTWLFFGIAYLVAAATANVLVTAAGEVVLSLLALTWLMRHLGVAHHGPHQVALATGLLSFLIVLAGIEQFFGDWGAFLAIAATVALLNGARVRQAGPARAIPLTPAPPGATT